MVAHGLGWHALKPFPGYTGRPNLARPESGRIFAAEVARGYAEIIGEVQAGRTASPSPPMKWVATLTANGRLAPKPPSVVLSG
ncbi:hypothetical protein BH09MYX1_BH09MYX1_29980 [soil metagenome]